MVSDLIFRSEFMTGRGPLLHLQLPPGIRRQSHIIWREKGRVLQFWDSNGGFSGWHLRSLLVTSCFETGGAAEKCSLPSSSICLEIGMAIFQPGQTDFLGRGHWSRRFLLAGSAHHLYSMSKKKLLCPGRPADPCCRGTCGCSRAKWGI